MTGKDTSPYRPLAEAPRHRVVIVLDKDGEETEAIHNGRAWHPWPINGQTDMVPPPTMGRW